MGRVHSRAMLDADLVVTRAAAALTVHRNTMLGRLDRIVRVTGRAPRRFRDAAVLHVGLLLDVPTAVGAGSDPIG